jgi:hypothetical protein
MTIKLTRTVQRIETYPAMKSTEGEESYSTVMVVYSDLFDDPNDEQLPVTATNVIHIEKGDDYSKEDQLVQTICSAIWS